MRDVAGFRSAGHIYCTSALSLHRESTNSLINQYCSISRQVLSLLFITQGSFNSIHDWKHNVSSEITITCIIYFWITTTILTFSLLISRLHEAASKGHVKTVLDLLEKGADIDSKDTDGVSMTILLTVDLISRISRKVLYLLLICHLKTAETSGLFTSTIFTSLITWQHNCYHCLFFSADSTALSSQRRPWWHCGIPCGARS